MKRIVICGAGEIGRYASEVLAKEGYQVCVVDVDSEKIKIIEENSDIDSLVGSCCLPDTIKKAKVSSCDVLIAATNSDEVNLLTAAIAKQQGAKTVIARIHDRDFLAQDHICFMQQFGIDHLICPEKLTSEGIVANLADSSVLEVDHFHRHELEIYRYRVPKDSPAIDELLSVMQLPPGVRIAVVERGEDNAFTPNASTKLEVGDVITVISSVGQFQEAQKLFSANNRESQNHSIAILGCSSLSEWLLADLEALNFDIRVFEPNLEKAQKFSEEHPEVTVLNSNPTDPGQFRAEHIERCRAFIAVSDDDEQNILAGLQTKKLGVKLTAVVVHAPTFLNLLANIGIDLPFSPRIVAARELLRLIDDSEIKCIATLAPNVAFLYEVLCESGKELNKPLSAIKMPKGSFLASITRNNQKIAPSRDVEVVTQDRIVIVGPANVSKQLKKMFVKR